MAARDMAATLHIGELSARTGRSVHAIRWYETQGLMPGVARDAGGRRVYVARHVEWLALLERLRATGMSVAEMRRYAALVKAGRGTLKERRDLLAGHRARVQQTIAGWTEALELIEAKVDFYAAWLESGVRPAQLPSAGRAASPTRAASAGRRKRGREATG
jgi:DNA-binding transcriptional MerR regulator